jgi:flagellar basal-body rod modification protein FlgD
MFEALQNSSNTGISGGQAKAPKNENTLGPDDFLKLMITQFQNQDPFSPMENGEFMAQLAQFSSASGINEMKQSFDKFAGSMLEDQGLRSANLVGRNVLVDGGKGYLPPEGFLGGTIKLPSGVENLTVRIQNEAGETVNELPLGRQSAGDIPFNWDGSTTDGRQVPPGKYTITAEAVWNGETKNVDVLTASRVTSVTLGRNGESPTLSLEGIGDRKLSAVRQIQ